METTDSWIVVIGLEKNRERLLVLCLWFRGTETRGVLSSGFRFEEGATGGRSLQGGGASGEETESGGW